jgi:hypothetical protein
MFPYTEKEMRRLKTVGNNMIQEIMDKGAEL